MSAQIPPLELPVVLAAAPLVFWDADIRWPQSDTSPQCTLRLASAAAARRLLGLEEAEDHVCAQMLARLLADDMQVRSSLRTDASACRREFSRTDEERAVRWFRDEIRFDPVGPDRWCAMGVVTEITAQRNAEAALADLLTGVRCVLWQAWIEAGETGIHWTFQVPHLEAAARFLGLSLPDDRPDGLFAALQGRVSSEDRAAMDYRSVEAIRQGAPGYSQEFDFLDDHGAVRRLREDVRLFRIGPHRWRAVGVNIDVTGSRDAASDRRQALEDLASSREQYLQLFLNIPTGVYRATIGGQILIANPALVRMMGYESLDALKQRNHTGPRPHGSYASPEFVERLKHEGAVRGWEDVWERYDGSRIYIRENVHGVYSEQGELLLYEGTVEDITERRWAEEQTRWQATHDALTGLPNRRLFAQRLEEALQTAERTGRPLALLFVDLDRFKQVNDCLGHEIGDDLLRIVARRLCGVLCCEDRVFRMGGDEFTLLLPGVAAAEVRQIARRIRRTLRAPVRLRSQELVAAASIGVSVFPTDGIDSATLLRHADIAMYRAKDQGGDGFRFFTPDQEIEVAERLRMEIELRRALARAELTLFYQPQIDARTGRVIGVEALVRWLHPERGLTLPGAFLPLAEETGLILAMGDWILRTACRQAVLWERAGHPVRVSVNLSARQLAQHNLATRIGLHLSESGLSPKLLGLELTETALLKHGQAAGRALQALKAQGVRLQVDDFGTGFSSLASLRQYRMDVLKIDQAFVRGVSKNPEDIAIVRAVVELGHAFGMEVIAEGIESAAQVAALRGLHCDAFQGFFYGPPAPAEQIAALLAQDAVLSLAA